MTRFGIGPSTYFERTERALEDSGVIFDVEPSPGLKWMVVWREQRAQPVSALQELDSLVHGLQVRQALHDIDRCGVLCSCREAEESILISLHTVARVLVEIM